MFCGWVQTSWFSWRAGGVNAVCFSLAWRVKVVPQVCCTGIKGSVLPFKKQLGKYFVCRVGWGPWLFYSSDAFCVHCVCWISSSNRSRVPVVCWAVLWCTKGYFCSPGSSLHKWISSYNHLNILYYNLI